MNSKELTHILLAIIVSAFAVSFSKLSLEIFSLAFLFFLIIFVLYITAKKLAAYYLQCDSETKIWYFQRYGWYERSYLKTPIPVGIILPFLLTILSLGKIPWLATTQTEITASKAKVAKRHGIYRYSELTDRENGLIAASGIFILLIFAVIAYFIGVPEFSKYAILFSAFNLIPLGNLDGTKIFFGNVILWFILAVLSLIGVAYILVPV